MKRRIFSYCYKRANSNLQKLFIAGLWKLAEEEGYIQTARITLRAYREAKCQTKKSPT